MANVFVEPRPKGRHEGDPIEDFVVENASNSSCIPPIHRKPRSNGPRTMAILPMSPGFVT